MYARTYARMLRYVRRQQKSTNENAQIAHLDGVIGNNFAKELNQLVEDKKKRDIAEERQRRLYGKIARDTMNRRNTSKIKVQLTGISKKR